MSAAAEKDDVVERISRLLDEVEKLAIDNNFPTAICVMRPNGVPVHCGVSGPSDLLCSSLAKLQHLTVIKFSYERRPS